MQSRKSSQVLALATFALALLTGSLARAADVTTVQVVSSSSSAQSNVPVTFGQVFKPGDVPAGAVIGGRLGSSAIALQVDKKATHRDGSLRHAVITAIVPSLGANASQPLVLTNNGSAPSGAPVALSALLATSFDASVSLNVGGTTYTASARDLLSSGTPPTWLSGPNTTEWLVNGPVRAGSNAHPHLQARFYVRAYQGLGAVRVEVVVENDWALESGPRNYAYNAAITVDGRGTVFTENNVTHYRQSRWRRVVWWGTQPAADVTHDGDYLAATRAVPNYDPRINMPSSQLDTFWSEFNANAALMGIGNLQPDMPAPAGRNAIGPLPAWAAAYIITNDARSKRTVVGYGQQAGAWPMHYRDRATDLPISIDTYPNATILAGGFFPGCGGDCSSPYIPEASHHPSLSYLPYLVSGDYYLMEELAFWSNWVLFYGESSRHGGSQGLVIWDQVRGQAWALRTLAHGAYLLPDSHPMKAYFNAKLQNNITYFINNWVDSNPLGYITNTGAAQWLALDNWIATWMDDFVTWVFGYIVGMGYTEAVPVLNWKAKFPVGRMTNPDMCWVLGPTYWPYVKGDRYLGGSSAFINNWADWKRGVILSWNDDAFRGTSSIAGREQELINAPCGSAQMASILGIGAGETIGYWDHLNYLANMQPALAVAVDQGIPNAQAAFDRLRNAANYPFDYNEFPQFAVWPLTSVGNLPSVSISANPTAVQSGQTSMLTWNATNAQSCSASGGWSGNKPLSGSETTPAITANTTFTLTCTNATGNSASSATVNLQSATPAPTLTLTANPTSVTSGGSAMLTWNSTNATSCTASGGWTGSRPTSGTESTGALTANRTYTLSCSGAGGSVQRSATVTVQSAPPVPTLTLTANPTSIATGGSTTLTWSTTNATSCTASGGWTGTRATSGSQTFNNLTASVVYTLQCAGAGGNVTRSAQVTVNASPPPPLPTVDLSATPTSVTANGSATLSWTSTNATACTASGGWSGTKGTQGSESTGALSNSTSYSLTCTGAGGSSSDSVTVDVVPGGGGGGGGSTTESDSGGGALGWLSLAFLGWEIVRRRRQYAAAPC